MSLPFPKQILDQHVFIGGKTGSGKSSKARIAVEYQLHKRLPVNIIDPKGDWWGLKSSADGRGPGFPIVIFGGPRADVPITAASGAEVARMIFAGNFASLIDLKGWMPSDRARFFIDYVAQIFKDSYGSRPMVVDECHNFAPKGKILSPIAGEMLHWANRLASEGRGLGINAIFASQRPQKVHNDLLTSCETLVACKVIHKADRDAIKDWIDGCADKDVGKQVLDEIASLPKPEAWVWCPEIAFGPKRVTFPMFETYDSFAPQAATKKTLRGWAQVDIEKMRDQLKSVVAEAEANNPAVLKKQISELQAQIRKGVTAVAPNTGSAIEKVRENLKTALESNRQLTASNKQLTKAIGDQAARVGVEVTRLERIREDLLATIGRLQQAVAPQEISIVKPAALDLKDLEKMLRKPGPIVVVDRPQEQIRRERNPGVKAGGRLQQILDQLEWLRSKGISPAPKATLAAVCGVRPTSGGYMQNLADLAKSGMVSYPSPGFVQATETGRQAAAPPEDADLPVHEAWLRIVRGPQLEILKELIADHPSPVPKVELAGRINVSPTSGGYMQHLADLKVLGAVEYPLPGQVGLTKYVMPE